MSTDALLTGDRPRLCVHSLNSTNPLGIPSEEKAVSDLQIEMNYVCSQQSPSDPSAQPTGSLPAISVRLTELSPHCPVIYVCVLVFLTSL